MIYKSLHNKLRIVEHEPLLKYGDKIGWDERVSKYVPTNDTVVVTLLTQQHTACVTALNSASPKTGPDHQNIAEILLKVALDNIILTCSLKNKRRLVPL
jgi:hypothetical protein